MKYFRVNVIVGAVSLLLILLELPLKAQETIVTYFKKNGVHTAQKDSATYTSILRLVPNESGLHELNEYYANGNLKRHGWVKAADARRLRFEGAVEQYYDNGALEALLCYADNKPIDTAKRYHKNGVLRELEVYLMPTEGDSLEDRLNRRLIYYADSLNNIHVKDGNGNAEIVFNELDIERGRYVNGLRDGRWEGTFRNAKYRFEEWYENGVVSRGVATDSLGKQYPYEQQLVQPEYPGGMQNLVRFISQNFRYPPEAVREKVSGQLRLHFVVDTTGVPTEFEVVEDLGYGTAAAGIEAVRKSQRWTPGYQRGVPVRVAYMLPIRLRAAPQPK